MNKFMKYRAYTKTTVSDIEKIDFDKGIVVDICGEVFNINDVTLVQSTGLEDKNGNLIYQGDILKESYVWENQPETDITVVEWLDDCASFAMLHVGFQNDFTFFGEYDVDLKNFEVIGNKFENPELLKAK